MGAEIQPAIDLLDNFFYLAEKWTFGVLFVVALVIISLWFAQSKEG